MTRHRTVRRLAGPTLLLAAALAPAPALAHPGHEFSQTLVAGLLHPLTGFDHLLMIIAVSAWAGLVAPPARIAVISCLALFVGIGATLPISGGAMLEGAIALTLVGAGILLAVGRKWPLSASAPLAAGFALVHGFAHGAEGPAPGAGYIMGLVVATGGLAIMVAFVASKLRGLTLRYRAVHASTMNSR